MSGNNPEVTFPQLRLEIQLLAEPGPVQIAWVLAENFAIDELAGQFSDSVEMWLMDLIRDGYIDGPSNESILAIEAELNVMRRSKDELLWTTVAALHFSPEWQRVRDLARTALNRLGVDTTKHDVLARVSPAKMIEALQDPIQWLARPADEQERWLIKSGLPVQDMLLRLGDCVSVLVPRLAPTGQLGTAAQDAIAALQDFIRAAATADDPALRDPTTLSTSETWATIRDLARAALGAVGE
jgi:hypothetical protein